MEGGLFVTMVSEYSKIESDSYFQPQVPFVFLYSWETKQVDRANVGPGAYLPSLHRFTPHGRSKAPTYGPCSPNITPYSSAFVRIRQDLALDY